MLCYWLAVDFTRKITLLHQFLLLSNTHQSHLFPLQWSFFGLLGCCHLLANNSSTLVSCTCTKSEYHADDREHTRWFWCSFWSFILATERAKFFGHLWSRANFLVATYCLSRQRALGGVVAMGLAGFVKLPWPQLLVVVALKVVAEESSSWSKRRNCFGSYLPG